MKRRIFLFLLSILLTPLLGAQTILVKSERLEVLGSVNVLNLSDSSGKVTDVNGMADLSNWEPSAIRVSLIGYKSQELPYNGKDLLVILEAEIKSLNDIIVEGFFNQGSLNNQPGAISRIKAPLLNRFDGTNLTNAVNTIPGIRFEQRAAASYRVSIRGSSIRSPFGVRNVKVYWNGIPFTEPGGNTFLNLLDLSNISDLEIIKGPSASAYGAGNGGVLKIGSTVLGANANSTSVNLLSGDFNTNRLTLSTNVITDKSSLTLKFANQSADSYRAHNAMDRSTIELDLRLFNSENTTFSGAVLYSDLDYQIPGGLNPDQRLENPQLSRPGSIDQNSSVQNELFLFKLGLDTKLQGDWSMNTNVGLSTNQFENPFILDYKRDNQQVFSLRSEFSKDFKIKGADARINHGIEYQRSYFDGKNFGNVNGRLDTIRFADNIAISQAIAFASYAQGLSSSTSFTLGLSYNALTYDIDRTIDRINNNPGSFRKEFDSFLATRFGISQQLGENYSIHLSVSNGLSNPTTTEVRTNEGSINNALQSEKGTNYELNFRGDVSTKLSFDLAVFQFNLRDAITTFTDNQGVVLFRNAGETRQNGIELSSWMNWLERGSGFLRSFSSRVAYTYHNFSFENYMDDGNDFSGNALPGTAPHVFNLQTDFTFSNGLYLNLTYHYSDPIPLNDENTFYSGAFNLVNTRLGYIGAIKGKTNFELYVGIDNLLDVSYSLGNDLNAFGRRFFQPAATRNFYFGLKLNVKH